ncbi:hypothetical protein [Lacinutrix sp. 5H-3-7-4]|uniref:hypothetical protein n=1 Tax=Lacinutrix sp. (strain 5H-3-7-4) TaxID=983544 RepID=UPI00020A3A7A|nr:hypothetical protein [Lacinutrix sp. 5H-3-7-4]AEH01095.1 hypothetical protein Lacal_1247 [Lacinutrix sp. 5H-3-7-4]
MAQKWITVKTVAFNNNCPECFSKEGLELTFKQEYVDTKFAKSITENITTEMECNVCNTQIFPVQWTEDIERVFNYQMKAFNPKKASKKLKPLFWIIVSVVLAIIITATILLLIN